jgi:hypothetical protein
MEHANAEYGKFSKQRQLENESSPSDFDEFVKEVEMSSKDIKSGGEK